MAGLAGLLGRSDVTALARVDTKAATALASPWGSAAPIVEALGRPTPGTSSGIKSAFELRPAAEGIPSALAPAYRDADSKHSKPGCLAAIEHNPSDLTTLEHLPDCRCGGPVRA